MEWEKGSNLQTQVYNKVHSKRVPRSRQARKGIRFADMHQALSSYLHCYILFLRCSSRARAEAPWFISSICSVLLLMTGLHDDKLQY